MAMRSRGRALRLEPASLAAALRRHAGPSRWCSLHGLCMNDLQWAREGHDHGAALARDLGYTPVYLHYNSGLHVSTNGRACRRADAGPGQPLAGADRRARIADAQHGRAGRAQRLAASASDAGMSWAQRLDRLAFLGTPHHGAPLERGGHWVDLLLGASKFSAPLARLGQLRSAGITDLRHGNVRDADWTGRDRFAHGAHGGDRASPCRCPRRWPAMRWRR